MGAVLFFHPQPQRNLLFKGTDRYGVANNLGVIVEDALIVATLIFGGILDACPDLKVCIAHGGGPACFGMGRLDHGWKVRSEARRHIQKPPSSYLRRLYYDCVTHSEAGLRLLLDHAGADRVVLGSDWPFVRWDPSPVAWVQGLPGLTAEREQNSLAEPRRPPGPVARPCTPAPGRRCSSHRTASPPQSSSWESWPPRSPRSSRPRSFRRPSSRSGASSSTRGPPPPTRSARSSAAPGARWWFAARGCGARSFSPPARSSWAPSCAVRPRP